MPKRNLHVAKNFTELNRQAQDRNSHYGKELNRLYRASDKLFETALKESAAEQLDEEYLYIICSRYMNLVRIIRDQLKDDCFFKIRFANRSHIEDLKLSCENSLLDRYKLNNSNYIIPINDGPGKETIAEGPMSALSDIKLHDKFVDVHIFYKLITDDKINVLIIDTRPANAYEECTMKHKHTMNIPGEVIRKGLSTNTLQQKLTPTNLEIFKKRYSYDLIVLVDIDTTPISYPTSKLEDLRCILTDWDQHQQYKIAPVVLDGGIKSWVDSYPTLIKNSAKIFNEFYGTLNDLMEDVEYPDLDKQEPATIEKVEPTVPVVERRPDATGARVTGLLQNILTVANNQSKVEDELLEYSKKCVQMSEAMIHDKKLNTNMLNQIKDISTEVSKLDSYRIELDVRRKHFQREYENIKTNLDEDLLKEFLQEINAADSNILGKFKMRTQMKTKEQELSNGLKQMTTAVEKTAVRNNQSRAVNNTPVIPDRKSKPTEGVFAKELLILRERFRNTGMTGLVNIRNTCYMNSLVQCLRYCPTFFIELTSYRNKSHMRLGLQLADLIERMWSENKVALRPSNFYTEVCRCDNYVKGYANGSHEDVQEFFIFVTKVLHKELTVPFDSRTRAYTRHLIDWQKTFENQDSFVNRAFFFQMELTSSCERCKKTVMKYEYGNTVFIALPRDGNPINLSKKVKEFTIVSPEEQEACKFCSQCENRMVLSKNITYYPSILSINIVRYDFSKVSNCILRRNNECFFYEKMFFDKRSYDLKAISLHSGNRDIGHYTALCKNPFDERWIEFNDESANYVNWKESNYRVRSYMLFYAIDKHAEEINPQFF